MTIEHRSYSHAVAPRGPGYVISRVLLLTLVGYVGMLIVQSFVVAALMRPPDPQRGNQLERSAVLQAVLTEGVRSTLSPWWKSAPWPDGVMMARIQSRLPMLDKVMLHSLIGSITFSMLGFLAGRLFLVHPALLLPPLLFFCTYGLLKSDLFPLDPITPVAVGIIVAVQFACLYGFALWGKWSNRG